MKKLVSLLLAAMLALTALPALAQTEMLGDTGLSLDLTDLELLDLTDEDADEDIVLAFCNEDESMQGVVYVYSADDASLQEWESYILEGLEGVTASGYTTINGIECFCVILSDSGDDFVIYFAIVDGDMIQFDFTYADDAAAALTGTVMNTLTLD